MSSPSRTGLLLKPNLRERERPVIADRYTRVRRAALACAVWRGFFADQHLSYGFIRVPRDPRVRVCKVLFSLSSALHAPRPHTQTRTSVKRRSRGEIKYVLIALPCTLHGHMVMDMAHMCMCMCMCICVHMQSRWKLCGHPRRARDGSVHCARTRLNER